MGFAVAEAAAEQGAEVVLVAVLSTCPRHRGRSGGRRQRARNACRVLAEAAEGTTIAAAAVGDFRPAEVAPHKIKKSGDAGLSPALTQNPDILADVAAVPRRPFLVGFAVRRSTSTSTRAKSPAARN